MTEKCFNCWIDGQKMTVRSNGKTESFDNYSDAADHIKGLMLNMVYDNNLEIAEAVQ